jgi:transcriptional regulator with XRE-family HTH domain
LVEIVGLILIQNDEIGLRRYLGQAHLVSPLDSLFFTNFTNIWIFHQFERMIGMFHSYHCFSPIPGTILLLATCKDEVLDAGRKTMNSLLKQERLNRHWSRAKVEEMTGVPQRSLENWEEEIAFPREENIRLLCKFYGKSPEALGLDKSSAIMGVGNNAPTSQEENPIVSDSIRRSALSDLGSYLIGLVSTWPRRNRHYRELQESINRAVIDHSTLVGQDAVSVLNRRQALMSLGLVPIQLTGSIALTSPKKIDTDTLLPYCAAGITACWYLRRGKDLAFVSDLTSSYIALLQPLVYSTSSEAYRKASSELLAQSFRLKSKLASALFDDDRAIAFEVEAIEYARVAESSIEQAIAHREMALLYWRRKKYGQALPYAETAYRQAKNTPAIIRSFTASGLSFCQASTGHLKEAQMSLVQAHDLFDPTIPTVASMPYGEAVLASVTADIKRQSGLWQEAADHYAKLLEMSTTALGNVENCIDYAKTEVTRDDKPRNMDLCIRLLTEAITGAKELGSARYQREARETFDLLKIAWPREDAIKTLSKEHFGIK